MCNMAVSNRQWLPLEIEHKGAMHKMSKLIQETQGEVDCFA